MPSMPAAAELQITIFRLTFPAAVALTLTKTYAHQIDTKPKSDHISKINYLLAPTMCIVIYTTQHECLGRLSAHARLPHERPHWKTAATCVTNWEGSSFEVRKLCLKKFRVGACSEEDPDRKWILPTRNPLEIVRQRGWNTYEWCHECGWYNEWLEGIRKPKEKGVVEKERLRR